jgi:uncharacterized protein YktA (UPF0223 family)
MLKSFLEIDLVFTSIVKILMQNIMDILRRGFEKRSKVNLYLTVKSNEDKQKTIVQGPDRSIC